MPPVSVLLPNVGTTARRPLQEGVDQALLPEIEGTTAARSLWADAAATSANLATGANVAAIQLGSAASTTTLPGNLTVNGTVTTINTTNLTVSDALIYANDGGPDPSFAGMAWDQGAALDVITVWNPTDTRMEFGRFNTVGGTTVPAGTLGTLIEVRAEGLSLGGTDITADAALNVTATGANDLTFGARGGTTTFNEAGDVNLDVSFSATSIVGALNELGTGAVTATWAQVLSTGATSGGTNPTLSSGDVFQGADAATGGDMELRGGNASAGMGGQVTVNGGASTGGNSGGFLVFTAGAGGATGDGGNATVLGGTGGATTGSGGTARVQGGDAGGQGFGGPVTINGGNAAGVISAQGGQVNLNGGTGVVGGNAGAVVIDGGTAGPSGGGGAIRLRASAAGGSATTFGGDIEITSGAGGGTSGRGGDIDVTCGNATAGNSSGGSFRVAAGTGSGTSGGGVLLLEAGDGGPGTATGGSATVAAGDGATTGGLGGQMIVRSGSAVSGNFNGGALSVLAGAGAGTGDGGDVTIRAGNAAGTGTDGTVTIGDSNTSLVSVATSSVETVVLGGLRVGAATTADQGDIRARGPGDSEMFYDASTGILSFVNTAGASHNTDAQTSYFSERSGGENRIRLEAYDGSAAAAPQVVFTKGRGTAAAPSQVAVGDTLVQIQAQGQDSGSTVGAFGAITFTVDSGTVSGASNPGRIELQTTPDGAAALRSNLRVSEGGGLSLGTWASTSFPRGDIRTADGSGPDFFWNQDVGRLQITDSGTNGLVRITAGTGGVELLQLDPDTTAAGPRLLYSTGGTLDVRDSSNNFGVQLNADPEINIFDGTGTVTERHILNGNTGFVRFGDNAGSAVAAGDLSSGNGTNEVFWDASASTLTFSGSNTVVATADAAATNNLSVTTGDASGGDSGDLSVDVGTATGTTGDVNVGTANASNVNIGSATNNVGFFGVAAVGQSAAYTRNATVVEDRTLLASASATTTNNNNVLAALIADLQAIGILG